MLTKSTPLSGFSLDTSEEKESGAGSRMKKVETQLSKCFQAFRVWEVGPVVGKTETGKSTLIQCIAGHQLTETMCSLNSKYDKVTKRAVFEATHDALPGFEINHAKKSRTTHINYYSPMKEGK
eukprot:12557777-Ditylum_brightwellii.AAC.1